MPLDPTVGGTVLRRSAIQSPNFVHGVSGWAIFQDGSAEFNSIFIPPGSGGSTTFVQGTTPTALHVNDLWVNTANSNSIYSWNGSTWVQYQFGTGSIQAGAITAALIAANTITAAQIAANTITAGQLAAGIIYAGIINGTTVNAATFTGSVFIGSNFELRTTGEFYYSGTPALGNLIASNAPTSGTDRFGNAYLAGVANYTPGTTFFAVQLFQANVFFYSATSGAGPWTQVGNIVCTGGASGMQFQSSPGGFTFGGGALISLAGTATSPTQITTDTWHNMTLVNGWTNNASFVASRYKLMENKSVRVQGVIAGNAATSNQFFTLPAGYRPVSASGAPIGMSANAPAGILPQLRWDTSGNLTIGNLAVPVAAAIFFTQDIPLD